MVGDSVGPFPFPLQAYAEVRPRIKGRFATPAEVAALKAAEAAKLAGLQHALPADLDDVAVVPTC